MGPTVKMGTVLEGSVANGAAANIGPGVVSTWTTWPDGANAGRVVNTGKDWLKTLAGLLGLGWVGADVKKVIGRLPGLSAAVEKMGVVVAGASAEWYVNGKEVVRSGPMLGADIAGQNWCCCCWWISCCWAGCRTLALLWIWIGWWCVLLGDRDFVLFDGISAALALERAADAGVAGRIANGGGLVLAATGAGAKETGTDGDFCGFGLGCCCCCCGCCCAVTTACCRAAAAAAAAAAACLMRFAAFSAWAAASAAAATSFCLSSTSSIESGMQSSKSPSNSSWVCSCSTGSVVGGGTGEGDGTVLLPLCKLLCSKTVCCAK